MATQYTDGSFSETAPFVEAMKTFLEAVDVGMAKAFHVGTPGQIEDIKNEKSNRELIEDLQEEIAKMKVEREGLIYIPTTKEIQSI